MFSHEDVHWWFRGTRRVILSLAARALPSEGARVLDVGCGTGATLEAIAACHSAFGVDLELRGLGYCRRRGLLRVAAARAEALPFPDGAFDLTLALDVIEHIQDDHAALRELRRVTRPGGHLLLTVPAHPLLWSRHDVALHHKRRYRRRDLVAALEGADLRIETLSWYNAALFPPIAALRLLRRLGGVPTDAGQVKSDVALPPAPLNAALAAVLGAERWAVGRFPLPFGLSLIALVRRPA